MKNSRQGMFETDARPALHHLERAPEARRHGEEADGGRLYHARADFAKAEAFVNAMIEHGGPVFFRGGRGNEPPLHRGPIDFRTGRTIRARDGGDVTLIGTGT